MERLSREVRAYAVPGGSEEILLDLSVRQASERAASEARAASCSGKGSLPSPQAMKAAARAKL